MRRKIDKQSRYYWPLVFMLCMQTIVGVAENAPDLSSQLSELAKSHGIDIKNINYIEPAPAIPLQGDWQQQLKALLKDYNYALINANNGVIEKIIISSAKKYDLHPTPAINQVNSKAQQFRIGTTRAGLHHLVQTTMTGSGDGLLEASLIVDTGASMVVLPLSKKQQLGFSDQDLQPGLSDTANGQVQTLQGVLKSVRIGDVVATDVAVSFIADDKLPNSGLLGMSFLNRFRFMFDDAKNELLLMPARR